MPRSTRLLRLVAISLLAMPLAGCLTFRTNTSGIDKRIVCVAFEPIYYSRNDTTDTQKSIRQHNSAWDAVCTPPQGK